MCTQSKWIQFLITNASHIYPVISSSTYVVHCFFVILHTIKAKVYLSHKFEKKPFNNVTCWAMFIRVGQIPIYIKVYMHTKFHFITSIISRITLTQILVYGCMQTSFRKWSKRILVFLKCIEDIEDIWQKIEV